MTRTGKSNTVKKIIQATVGMSSRAPNRLDRAKESAEEAILSLTKDGLPKYPVGQIIFDINGEYANANLQDEGTAIFELFKDDVTRYSTLQKPGFKVMKVNFYRDISSGFELVKSHLWLGAATISRASARSTYPARRLRYQFLGQDSLRSPRGSVPVLLVQGRVQGTRQAQGQFRGQQGAEQADSRRR